MKKFFYFMLIGCLSCVSVQAQLLSISAKGQVVTGTPIGPLPENTSDASGAPSVEPGIGLEFNLKLSKRFGIELGAEYVRKGLRYDAPIAGKTRVSRKIFGTEREIPIAFKYEGRVNGGYDNQYLNFPLTILFRTRGKFSHKLGGYAAYLLNGSHSGTADVKVFSLLNFKDEPFDLSDIINTWDFGVAVGTEYRLSRKLSVDLGLQVGLKNINSENPEGLEGVYRNVYLSLGLSYRLLNLL